MAQLNITNMEAQANITFEAFKTLAGQGSNRADTYYAAMVAAAVAAGNINVENYANLARDVVNDSSINGQFRTFFNIN